MPIGILGLRIGNEPLPCLFKGDICDFSSQVSLLFLSRWFVFVYKLRWRNAHIFLELSAEKIHVGKITKLRDLRNGIAFKPKKVTSMVDLELNDVFLRGDTVYFLEKLLKIWFSHFAYSGKLAQRKIPFQKIIFNLDKQKGRILFWIGFLALPYFCRNAEGYR